MLAMFKTTPRIVSLHDPKITGLSKRVMYVAWIFSLPLSLLISIAITVLLSKLHLLESGEFGFIAMVGIIVIAGYAAPFVFLSIWGYLSRRETPRRVAIEGVVGIALQLAVFTACSPLITAGSTLNVVSFFWGALFGLGIPQLLLLGGIIILHKWHRPIKHIIMWATLIAVIVAVFVMASSVITLQIALANKVLCGMTFLPADWIKLLACSKV